MKLTDIFYALVGWMNWPDMSTPLGQRNLRHMDNGILQCAQYILALSQDKADMSEVNTMVQNVTLDPATGIMTVTLKNGTVTTYDLAIEKVVINFDITDDDELILTLADGTVKKIDLTRFVYDVASTDTISMQIVNRKISANIVDGSITMDKLAAGIVDVLRQYMFDAQSAALEAERFYNASKSWAVGSTGTRGNEDSDNSQYYSRQSEAQANRAENAAELAEAYASIVPPIFHIDWTTMELIQDSAATGMEFYLDPDTKVLSFEYTV